MLQARPASYLTPQPDYVSPDVATISDWLVTDIPYGKPTALDEATNPTREPDDVDAAAAETDATLQYLWRTLYPYENSDTEHAPTALEIKGQFRGTEVTRRIDFTDADKQPIPLVRNHRYLVRILPAPRPDGYHLRYQGIGMGCGRYGEREAGSDGSAGNHQPGNQRHRIHKPRRPNRLRPLLYAKRRNDLRSDLPLLSGHTCQILQRPDRQMDDGRGLADGETA
ncbi:MAG: hypothetical protein LUD46_14235 [Parabacteroides sp.]|nr:hypothetical protein [Parabacteroides sp.]